MTVQHAPQVAIPSPMAAVASAPSAAARASIAARLQQAREEIVPQWLTQHFDPAFLARYAVSGVSIENVQENRDFVSSLLDLLVASVRDDQPGVREVYLDERLRYAPHQADPATVVSFFNEILATDETTLLRVLPADQHDTAECIFAHIHAPLRERPRKDAVRLLAVGDCLLNEVRVFLPTRVREANIGLDMRCLYFSAVAGRALSTVQVADFLEKMSPQLISFSFLTYAGLPPFAALLREADTLSEAAISERVVVIMASIREYLEKIRTLTDAPFLVHNASGLPLTRWRRLLPLPPQSRGRLTVLRIMNEALEEYCRQATNTVLIDELAVAQRRGYRQSSQPIVSKDVTKSSFFHWTKFGEFLATPYEDVVRSFHTLRKAKVLLVDFDNTLWDGVMADGAVQHHTERQQLLRTLKDAGMLLVSVSKNTMDNVRWEEMVLSPTDFALHKINWDQKVASIAAAAQELDLGLDSFVLIDDNPAERDLVERELPTVQTLDATDPATWRSLERLLAFPNTQATDEAKARTEMYRAAAERRETQSSALDYPSMMRSLQMQAAIGRARASDLDRVVELVQRTNQFNTTTIRYQRAELKAMIESAHTQVYVADLADKFGKYGLVAVAVVNTDTGESNVESFVMSCRAMGYGLEQLLLNTLIDEQPPHAPVRGRFIASDRNSPSSTLFADAGFEETAPGHWQLADRAARPPRPDWLTRTPRL